MFPVQSLHPLVFAEERDEMKQNESAGIRFWEKWIQVDKPETETDKAETILLKSLSDKPTEVGNRSLW